MVTPGSDPPAPASPPHTWRSMAVGLGLFCVIGGLFLAAGFKDALWPKVVGGGGVVILVVGLVANAMMSRRRSVRDNNWAARREAPPDTSDVEVSHE